MAGHSKWAQIKRTKAVVDAKRGAVFTRLGREITVAARAGADPAGNFQLRTAIEKAKAAGVPNSNIERAIAKGSGQAGSADSLEAVRYEGYGPGGVAVLVEAFTDNRNRTAADLRLVFNKAGGNLGETGCVSFLFDQRSLVRLDPAGGLEEEALLEALLALEEAGGPAALSYSLAGEDAEVIGRFEDLEALQGGLRQLGLPVRSWEHRWLANTVCRIEDPDLLKAILRMLDALDDLEDVRSVTANLEAEESLMEAALA